MQKQPFEKHVWAEIDLEALRYNFREVKARAGALPLCAVVKADSYGHGAVQCARVFAEEGAAWLAVSCLTEAVQLRKAGQTLPILILGHVQPAYAAALIQNDITVACYSLAQAHALSEAAVAAGGSVTYSMMAQGEQQLMVVPECGGKVNLYVDDKGSGRKLADKADGGKDCCTLNWMIERAGELVITVENKSDKDLSFIIVSN